jgi:hypothetical protein
VLVVGESSGVDDELDELCELDDSEELDELCEFVELEEFEALEELLLSG